MWWRVIVHGPQVTPCTQGQEGPGVQIKKEVELGGAQALEGMTEWE